MKTHDLIQGSAQWLAYRTQHFNASDAPAMLGVSPYKTRSQLLHELHTGLTPEVDQATQRRFDDGHAAESAARPMAEEIVGQDLYPVVGSDGELSASFDGLVMDESIVWEHKLMNVDLAYSLADGVIPDQYHPQLEQQLLVSGAEKVLFMGTSLDRTAMEHVWYYSNPALRKRLIDGWKQFAEDLANYKLPAVTIEAVGRTPETLPALHIQVTGMVTASNLAAYKEHALAVFSGINRELTTDQHFADAEKVVKWCGDVEDRLEAAKQHALSQTASIDQLFKAIDDIAAEARRTRLELDKLVKGRKEALRVEIVTEGVKALATHLEALNTRIGKPYMPAVVSDFAGAIKGKRTLDSMRDAVATTLANAKIEANAIADKIHVNMRALNEKPELAFLFSDVRSLVLKEPDFVEMTIKSRVAEHQAIDAARIETERQRIANEERAKAEASERARADAEIAAAKLASEEAIAKAAAVDKSFSELEQAEIKRLADLNSAVIVEAQKVVQMPTRTAPAPGTPPSLALGEISARLGFNVTSAFLSTLGFDATTVRAAKLYHERDFALICARLVSHIQNIQATQAA